MGEGREENMDRKSGRYEVFEHSRRDERDLDFNVGTSQAKLFLLSLFCSCISMFHLLGHRGGFCQAAVMRPRRATLRQRRVS